MKTNSEFVTRMQAQLKKWDADVASLTEEGKKATDQARASYDEGIKGLRASRDAAQKTFQQICVASESAGAQLHAGMEGAWTTMQANLDKVLANLRK